ncbi:MAG TPA: hypothetical protein VGQ99_17900 [Tepidisphaeraceae bacterium]|jgi:hypothetical protein|nr:hypothetical protein [Tepidisphaeraceae bacterium]
MRRWFLALSGLVVILSSASLVRWAAGYRSIMPWPAIVVVLGAGGVGFMLAMQNGGVAEEPVRKTKRKYVRKKRPVLRSAPGRKRAWKKAVKRRRARKAGTIFLSRENPTAANPGGEQVGFFG